MMKLTVRTVRERVGSSPAQLRAGGTDLNMRLGEERWIPPGSTVTVANIGSPSNDFLRFDFKTQPIDSSNSR